MSLTELQVKNAKPKEKRYIVNDGGGLNLEVMPNGNRFWRLRYWENGKERKISLGKYPAVSLRDARLKRDEINVNRAQGIPPKAKPLAEANTFEAIGREWHEKQVLPKAPPYAEKVLSILRRLIFPHLGARDIKEISATDILAPLRLIEMRGNYDTAHTARQVCGQIFRYAIATARAERNPAADLKGALSPVIHKHNASITDPAKIGELLRKINRYQEIVPNGTYEVQTGLMISAYVFPRPGELRFMEWSEVDFERAEWRVPAEKMKMDRTHIVPLARQVIALLKNLKQITGHRPYAFSLENAPMSENTIGTALRRLGFKKGEMTAHGFRGMASTNLNEQGWPFDAIERQLAHVEKNGVRAAYNYAEYLPKRREMMQHWADWLDSLTVQKPPSHCI